MTGPTIQAIHDAGSADGRCLQVARGGSGAVTEGVEDATADACRADALAARVLGTVADDGVRLVGPRERRRPRQRGDRPGHPARGVRPDRDPRRPTRPRTDRTRDRPARDVVAAAGHRPGRRPPPRLRPHHLPPRQAPPLRPRPQRRLPHPALHQPGRVPHTARPRPRVPRTGRATPTTAASSAPHVTSSRPPATPTSPTPRPTAPAPGPPPGARTSTSRPARSCPSSRTHHRSNWNHRHPTTRHLSDPTQFVRAQACSGDAVIPGVDHDLDPVP